MFYKFGVYKYIIESGKNQAPNVTCFIMYVTFLLEKRVFVLCNMENGGRKREEKPKALSGQR